MSPGAVSPHAAGTCPICGRAWRPRDTGQPRYDADGIPTLSTLEARLIDSLRRGPRTRAQLIAAMYRDADGGPLSAETCLSIRLRSLKRKMRGRGFTIENTGGRGNALYRLKKDRGA